MEYPSLYWVRTGAFAVYRRTTTAVYSEPFGIETHSFDNRLDVVAVTGSAANVACIWSYTDPQYRTSENFLFDVVRRSVIEPIPSKSGWWNEVLTLQNIEILMSYTWVNLLGIPEEYKRKECAVCFGSGKFRCHICKGTGRMKCFGCNGRGRLFNGTLCSKCVGRGYYDCEFCYGTGKQMCGECNGTGVRMGYGINFQYAGVSDVGTAYGVRNCWKLEHREYRIPSQGTIVWESCFDRETGLMVQQKTTMKGEGYTDVLLNELMSTNIFECAADDTVPY